MRMLIVGFGEVGSALYEIAVEGRRYGVYGYDIDSSKSRHRLEEIPRPIDYLHVAIPFKSLESFVGIVKSYVDRFSPRMVFIHSTVAPGTSRRIYEGCRVPTVYTPYQR